VRISYDDLVRDYLDSLHSKLRNFSVEPEFLATWVHDEDDATSLYEIFAAAREAGCGELSVGVGAQAAGRVDRAGLEKRLAPLGAVRVEVLKDGAWEIVATLSGKPSPSQASAAPKPKARPAASRVIPACAGEKRPEGTHPAYRAALAALSAAPRREGAAPKAPAGGLLIDVSDGDAHLAVAVGAEGVVIDARHRGASGELRGLLDGLCELLPGRPFQEGHDHAVIRLEARLRDRGLPSPVRGLLTPRNADPVFARPLAMLRAAYRRWSSKFGAAPGWNFWDDKPAAGWLALPQNEKLARAKAAVAGACRTLGIPAEGVEVLDLLGDCRIVIAYTPQTASSSFAKGMFALERALKAKIDPRIEVQLESLEDRNRRADRTQRSDRQL
jgi:hypothetical protein